MPSSASAVHRCCWKKSRPRRRPALPTTSNCDRSTTTNSRSFVLPAALLSRSFRCIAYDLPSGREDGADLRRLTHADLVRDLFAVLDHAGARQSYLFGSGFGTTLALAALRAAPERLPRAV